MAETHHFDVSRLFDVKGWVCVVTGGGTGIGLMATQALAANGAKVYITGRRKEVLDTAASYHSPELDRAGGSIHAVGPCDVSKKSDLEALVKEIGAKEKSINLLVCNAGIGGPKVEPDKSDAGDLSKKLWENESVEEWQETYKVDVTSVYFTTLAFLPLLQASMSDKSRSPFSANVITISSMSGMMRHAQGHFSYNAAKGATVHLTKLMSAEFQKAKIRVNSIAPGYFPSEMTANESDHKNKSEFPSEKIEQAGHVPLERAGRETEMGMTVLYLAKNEYVNGVIIPVDGGVLNVVGG